MTNYNLAEFKTWLGEDQSKKLGLGWAVLDNKGDLVLDKLIQQEEYNGTNFKHFSWNSMRSVVLRWVGEKEIASLKQKLTTFINSRKTQLQQEIQLIKEVLND